MARQDPDPYHVVVDPEKFSDHSEEEIMAWLKFVSRRDSEPDEDEIDDPPSRGS